MSLKSASKQNITASNIKFYLKLYCKISKFLQRLELRPSLILFLIFCIEPSLPLKSLGTILVRIGLKYISRLVYQMTSYISGVKQMFWEACRCNYFKPLKTRIGSDLFLFGVPSTFWLSMLNDVCIYILSKTSSLISQQMFLIVTTNFELYLHRDFTSTLRYYTSLAILFIIASLTEDL